MQVNLLLRIKVERADFVVCAVAVLLATHAAQDGFDAESEFFHGEGLRQVVISTDAEAFQDVFLEGLGREEDDGYVGI